MLVDARQARNRALIPGALGCGVWLRLRRPRARHCDPVAPKTLLGGSRVAVSGTRSPVQIVLKGWADRGISKAASDGSKQISRSIAVGALSHLEFGCAAPSSVFRRSAPNDGYPCATASISPISEARADTPKWVQTRDFSLHDGWE